MRKLMGIVPGVLLLVLTLLAPLPVCAGQAAYSVETITDEWIDSKRADREVPIKAYLPKDVEGPCPVVIFSHGLGGTREGYSYLGEYWASHGYVSVHIQHLGSDDSVWRDVRPRERLRAMRASIRDISNSLNRPIDVSFVLDELEKRNADADSAWHNRLDMSRVGMAGHSYGAFTTTAVAGQTYLGRNGRSSDMSDPRIKAAIPMSPQAPRNPDHYDASYESIAIPMFYMTGTHDESIVSTDTSIEDRRVAFDYTPGPADGGPEVYLVTFTNGDHMIFSGRPRRGFDPPAGGDDEVFQEHIREATLAFWNAYLNGDKEARRWLREGGFAGSLGEAGVLEVKP